MTIDFSIVIPTYNSSQRLVKLFSSLEECLNYTKNQLNLINIEIIIVDNNSQDDTAKIIQEYQNHGKYASLVKYYFQPEQGAAFARLMGVQKAEGELIAFVDDDNLLQKDWLVESYQFCQNYPQAGAVGGQIHGVFAVTPPENFQQIQKYLAIIENDDGPRLFKPDNLQLPPSAALIVRKKAWQESVPDRPALTGKLPGLFIQGDDYEPLLYLHKKGWEIWYNPALHSYHQIPAGRLERDYLLRLAKACGLPICRLRMINAKPLEKPLIWLRTVLGNLRRLLGHLLKYRTRVKTDLVPAFELQFYWGSFLSAFYYFIL